MAICHCRPQIRRNDDGTTFPKPRNTQKSPDHEYIIPGMIVAPCFHQKRSQLAGKIRQKPPPPLSGEPQILIPHWNQTYKSTLHITRILYMTLETIHTLQNDFPTKNHNFPAKVQEHSRTQPHNQTDFSICFRTRNSTYNIPKRREKHVLQHGIIQTIKQTRLQKSTI